jgi:antitoxin (DNA-binding transcriptional repressor) of toxin-antitoxin stability system
MKTIGAAKFKEQCLALLDRIEPEGLVITKHGRPVALLLPWEGRSARLIGSLEDRIEVHGDLFTTGVEWDADRQP